MAIMKKDSIEFSVVKGEDILGTIKSNVIGSNQGWENHTLRLFRLAAGGQTPHHQHDWEHVNYVTKGKGTLMIGNQVTEISQGDFAFVPPNTMHQFRNPHDSDFEFICIVPNKGAY